MTLWAATASTKATPIGSAPTASVRPGFCGGERAAHAIAIRNGQLSEIHLA